MTENTAVAVGRSASAVCSGEGLWRLALPGSRQLELGGGMPAVMGIVNLTPDSFSDGGSHAGVQDAVAAALDMFAEGATIVDLGAESTRPGGGVYGQGAGEVSWREECDRLLPVLEQLRDATGGVISVDTRKARVAEAALAAGADLINDVSCLADPDMADLLAAHCVPVVLMHSRGEIPTMQRGIDFRDVVAEVRDELVAATERAAFGGIAVERVIVDPGIGFGKTAAQNLTLLRGLDDLAALARPVLVGASRKAFIGEITGEPPGRRVAGSLAAAGWATGGRAQIVRVHDVAETHRFLRVWGAIQTARESG